MTETMRLLVHETKGHDKVVGPCPMQAIIFIHDRTANTVQRSRIIDDASVKRVTLPRDLLTSLFTRSVGRSVKEEA